MLQCCNVPRALLLFGIFLAFIAQEVWSVRIDGIEPDAGPMTGRLILVLF